MKSQTSINRRDFLKISSVAGIGLLVSLYVPGCAKNDETPTSTSQPTPTRLPENTAVPSDTPAPVDTLNFTPNVYITMGMDGSITLTCPRPDMGQGTRTALPMILAEELGADWSSVRVAQADANFAFGDQQAGGSTSVYMFYNPLRIAGALVRSMLVYAAAQKWGTTPENCSAENSIVTNKITNETLPYSALVETAMTYNPDDFKPPKLKHSADFSIIGTSKARVDGQDMVTGKAVFGMDVKVPDMAYAAVARCPVFGGSLVSFDDSLARAIPGVIKVVEITSGKNGINANKSVAVIARDTWSAIKGRNALKVTWDEGKNSTMSSADIEQKITDAATTPTVDGFMSAYYTVPFFSHSPMEPMNSTSKAGEIECEIWSPTQDPQTIQRYISQEYDLTLLNTHVHVPLVGGGFGRRIDIPPQSTRLPVVHFQESYECSLAAGAPVKVVWTRDDDMHFEYYHPMSVTKVSARLDDIRSITTRMSEASGFGIPTGPWRAVTNVPEAFAHESFMDEYAIATHQDTIDLHHQVLWERAKPVLDMAVEKSNWGSSLPAGHGRGLAIHSTWDQSPCAQVAEVMVDDNGNVHVLKVVCVIDCGVVINPDMVKAQMEGGIIFGLTAALKEEITITNGRVDQSNFHNYPLLKLDELPEIEVYIIKSDENPTGIGEMANPPTAPAVANAVFAATGTRIRRLPIRPQDLVND